MFLQLFAKISATIKRGRLAKTISFLVKHSSAADGDETTTVRRLPNWRKMIGPYLAAIWAEVRKNFFLRRWRWPIMGRHGKGLGGRFWILFRKCFVKM